MVIDINRQRSGINEFLENINTEVTEMVNEFYYSILADKYSYLQENGVVMEAEQEQAIAQGRFKQFIEKIKQAFKDAFKWISGLLKTAWQKLTGKKKEEVKQDIENTNKEAAETEEVINNATNPEEASAAVQKFIKKQQEKAKKYQAKDQEKLNSFKLEQEPSEVQQSQPERSESTKPAEQQKPAEEKTSAQPEDQQSIYNQLDKIRKEISIDDKSIKKCSERIKNIDAAIKTGPNKDGMYFLKGDPKKSLYTLEELKDLRTKRKNMMNDANDMKKRDINELHRLQAKLK